MFKPIAPEVKQEILKKIKSGEKLQILPNSLVFKNTFPSFKVWEYRFP